MEQKNNLIIDAETSTLDRHQENKLLTKYMDLWQGIER